MTKLVQKEKPLFLTVSKPIGAQEILYDAMVLYLRKTKGQEVRLAEMNVKRHILPVFVDPQFYLSLIYLFGHVGLCTFSKGKRLAMYKYNGIEIGRYAAAAALHGPNACIKKAAYKRRFIFCTLKGIIYYSYARWISERISYAYLHDTGYLRGIIVDTFLKSHVQVFIKANPYNIMLCCGPKLNQNSIKVRRDDREGFCEEATEQYMFYRLKKPSQAIPYFKVKEKKNSDAQLPVGKCAVVYAHSFTDIQLECGYDGFNSVYEWLIFTIDLLKDCDVEIIVKGHPNFWSPVHEAQVKQWDRQIWQQVTDKYSGEENISFIDWPMNNYTLLSKLDKEKVLLVSHHSNALVEGAFLGFMTLSSACSLWSTKYSFGAIWENPLQYHNMLKQKWNFPVSRKEALRFVHDKYKNPFGRHGRYFWVSIIAKHIGIDIKTLCQKPSLIRKEKMSDYEALLDRISDGIVEINE